MKSPKKKRKAKKPVPQTDIEPVTASDKSGNVVAAIRDPELPNSEF
jgi:hypothetical protein